MRVYEGAPHNICDAFPNRCAGDVLDFLGRRFGWAGSSRGDVPVASIGTSAHHEGPGLDRRDHAP